MTICVACIADNDVILGVSDRMLTAGDVQFEPPDIKVRRLTGSIAILTAADSDLHDEMYQNVLADLKARREINPDENSAVKDIAYAYAESYNDIRAGRAERALLGPLRLTVESFVRQDVDANLVSRLATEMINYDAGTMQAIIAGIDDTGPHLWVVHNESVRCHDRAGFAAIGAGEWHAKSQFMFAEYSRFASIPTAMRLLYSAKKRAEVAPGVGTDTDMFWIGPELGSFTWFQDVVLQKLGEIYNRLRQDERVAAHTANEEVHRYAEELAEAAARAASTQEQEAITEDSGGVSPSDQKQLRDGSEDDESQDGEQAPAAS